MPHAVPPWKAPNATRRSREYLTPRGVDTLIAAARRLWRHGHREATMLLLAYRHGLRVSELVTLRWEQVDLQSGVLHVRRQKNGLATTHPLNGSEIRVLRALARACPDMPYVFVSERQGPLAGTMRNFYLCGTGAGGAGGGSRVAAPPLGADQSRVGAGGLRQW